MEKLLLESWPIACDGLPYRLPLDCLRPVMHHYDVNAVLAENGMPVVKVHYVHINIRLWPKVRSLYGYNDDDRCAVEYFTREEFKLLRLPGPQQRLVQKNELTADSHVLRES